MQMHKNKGSKEQPNKRQAGVQEMERPGIKKRLKRVDLPKEWLELIKKSDGTYKKVVMYHMSLPTLMNDTKRALEKMAEVMEIFAENSENIVIWWRPHPLAEAMLKDYRTDSRYDAYGTYVAMKDEFIQNGHGIYDDTDDYDRAATVADAYYGGEGMELPLCFKEKIPIMIQNIDVMADK